MKLDLLDGQHLSESSMSEQTYKKEDIVLVEAEIIEDFSAPAKLPENLDAFGDLRSKGIAKGVLPLVFLGVSTAYPILPGLIPFSIMAIFNNYGGVDQIINNATETKEALKGLSFKTYPKKPIQIKLVTNVVVLKCQDGSLDVVLTHKVTYSTAYNILPPYDGDGATQASLYRDNVNFTVIPRQPSDLISRGAIPVTAIKEAHYSFQTSWSVGGGFSGNAGLDVSKEPKASGSVGFNVNGSYSFSSTTSTSKKDFELKKDSGDQGALTWTAKLKNVYENYGREGHSYDPSDPYKIVRNNPFTAWISGPPDSATADLDLPFLNSFKLPASAADADVIKFDIAASQRLIHAVSLGRWGAPTGRMGGQAFILPNYFDTASTLVIDLKAKTARLENKTAAFKTAVDRAQETIELARRVKEEESLRKK